MLHAAHRVTEAEAYIGRITDAKKLVVGVPSQEVITTLRQNFEAMVPLMEQVCRWLNSGDLDKLSDDELRSNAVALGTITEKLAGVIEGGSRIGLEAVDPFPQLLSDIKGYRERLQSSLEGMLLSLNDSFADLMEKSAREINLPA
jgi:hypothetical protein